MGRYIDRPVDDRLKVRAYDCVAALLITLLILTGTTDHVLFLMWVEPPTPVSTTRPQPHIELLQPSTSPYVGDTFPTIEPPGADELTEFSEPSTELLLEAVTDIAALTAEQQQEVIKTIASTVFGVRRAPDGFEFYVISQSYLDPSTRGNSQG